MTARKKAPAATKNGGSRYLSPITLPAKAVKAPEKKDLGAVQKRVSKRRHRERELSLPHILAISNTNKGKGHAQVNLFNRADALFEDNFGNQKGITIQYVSNSPLVPYSYRRFLFNDVYFKVGLIEIRSEDKAQQAQTLSLLFNKGRGMFECSSLFPRCQPSIKGKEEKLRKLGFPFAHFILEEVWIQPNTSLSFLLKNGATVVIYLYPTQIFDPTIGNGIVEMDLPDHYQEILAEDKRAAKKAAKEWKEKQAASRKTLSKIAPVKISKPRKRK